MGQPFEVVPLPPYEVVIPRTTYNGLVAFLQEWSRVYREPGATVLRGSLRNPFGSLAEQFVGSPAGAESLAGYYERVLNVLGQGKVEKNVVTLDLRFLSNDEMHSVTIVADVATLRSAQTRALERLSREIQDYTSLPEMVRLALAAM